MKYSVSVNKKHKFIVVSNWIGEISFIGFNYENVARTCSNVSVGMWKIKKLKN